ncbi:MAG: PorP/SprF family type IX secretion system membrane protein [Saprospiraceae bacterium]|nr:PorP/SprF family type IX secretion system membrane protein [Saprospiraceae bacterium]
MKKTLLSIIFGVITIAAFAQEQAVYTHYQVFPILVNPGYTGFEDEHQFLGNARTTWTGFPGRPVNFTAIYHGPVGEKLALGGGLFSEKVGDMNTVKLNFNYAFRFRIQKARIGIGLSTDFINRRVNPDLLSNPLVQPNDDVLENLSDGQQIFDASAGTHILYDERFFVSITLPNIVRARLDEVPIDQRSQQTSLFEHYIFQVGYIVDVPSQNFKIMPSLAFRQIRDTPFQVDVNVQGRFLDEKLITGLTYRPSNNGSVGFLIGTKYKALQLAYSYDVSFSKFQQFSTGSHELTAAFNLPRKTPKPVSTDTSDLYQ